MAQQYGGYDMGLAIRKEAPGETPDLVGPAKPKGCWRRPDFEAEDSCTSLRSRLLIAVLAVKAAAMFVEQNQILHSSSIKTSPR